MFRFVNSFLMFEYFMQCQYYIKDAVLMFAQIRFQTGGYLCYEVFLAALVLLFLCTKNKRA